ncbi:uncharacterized protein HMPREF1541_04871 [Cyphellophora europaea CBS 101466]|uniref:Uncharacterized protein n=1 Tax=Cyphellophora europaea (strain CBS 101466) TaxID=1220924 RepID=W2RY40_CYPE1|nr:uncharacterized protein HMPREF1541_04871 [Cyphellophora europaea CBS 101466]ETN40594.1 hypothetical protein HMPREF1541_04871 [Cyphellophora europaea CBS 101466]
MPSQLEITSSRLHRSKSAASVKERRKHPITSEPQNPEASRVHALIAAHRAMDRSQSHSSTDLYRAHSNASGRSKATVQHHVQFSPATQLRNQRSVLQGGAPRLSAALQVPNEPRKIHAYAEIEPSEFGPVSETFGAEPSSYRKIRRSKSLLTPRRRSFTPRSPHTPLSQAPTLRHAVSNANINIDGASEPTLGLRIRKSFNLLRPASRVPIDRRAETSTGYHDEAVSLARNQFLDAPGPPQAERKPSFILQKIRRPNKAFRKSVRSQAFTDAVNTTSSDPAVVGNMLPVSAKRSFSATVRHRFMKAFGKSVSNKATLPPQQLEATRRHFSTELEEPDHSTSFDDYHVDEDDERRQSFYVPSQPSADMEEELDRLSPTFNPSTSRESLHSATSRSRVTSWTNSSTTSSALRAGGLERNRLSIIKEDGGPHQPSSSAGRHIGGIGVFQDPLPNEDENGQPMPPVDSQRIYSALMRRIGGEEAEIEHTRTALEEIHNNQELNHDNKALDAGKSTIRAVSMTTQASSMSDGGEGNCINPVTGASVDPAQHQANVERRREELVSQAKQQSFFPFSEQRKRATPSSFRKLLNERKSEDLLRSSGGSPTSNTILAHKHKSDALQRSHICLSSESIYSRTTNGGPNESYVPANVGSDELDCPLQEVDDDIGMATIIPNRYQPRLQVENEAKPSTANSSEREWKGWIQGQVDTLTRFDSKTASHYREHAQIDPEDVGVGGGGFGRPTSRASTVKNFPLLDLKQVSSHVTPVPKRNSSLTKSHSGLLKQASAIDLKADSDKNDDTQKSSGTLRKISPGNIARMLKERKSQILRSKHEDVRKENRPSPRSESPPMSTPGRLGLQMRSGNGRLRKRASESVFSSKDDDYPTIKKSSTPGRLRALENDESPTDRVKQSLSARLSRPFNMDVPEPNRPFDSMYLGKTAADDMASGRLSVAPRPSQRGPGGYGGLGANPFDGELDTALPDIELKQKLPSGDSGKGGFAGLWSSKRMVSDFLKKRRMNGSDEERNRELSPAFV